MYDRKGDAVNALSKLQTDDRKELKKQLFGHFFIIKILCNIVAYSPITKAVTK